MHFKRTISIHFDKQKKMPSILPRPPHAFVPRVAIFCVTRSLIQDILIVLIVFIVMIAGIAIPISWARGMIRLMIVQIAIRMTFVHFKRTRLRRSILDIQWLRCYVIHNDFHLMHSIARDGGQMAFWWNALWPGLQTCFVHLHDLATLRGWWLGRSWFTFALVVVLRTAC